MNCIEVEGLIPAYLLGALEKEKRSQVEAHLRECLSCLVLFQEHAPVTTLLSSAGGVLQAPPELKQQVMETLGPHKALREERRAGVEFLNVLVRVLERPRGAVATALVALFLIGLSVGSLLLWSEVGDLREEASLLSATQSEQLERAIEENQRLQSQLDLAYTVAIPGVSTVMLAGAEDAPRSRGMLMISPLATWALLTTRDLDPLPEGKTYQLWLYSHDTIGGGDFVTASESGGLFTVDDTGYGQMSVRGMGPITDYQAVAVSVEPAQGSTVPTGAKVLGETIIDDGIAGTTSP